jgi:hypothetical protein
MHVRWQLALPRICFKVLLEDCSERALHSP